MYVGNYSDEDYNRLFRMRRDTFDLLLKYLVSKFPTITVDHIAGLEPVTPKKKLEITLFYLKSSKSLRCIVDKFNVCDSTVINAKDEVVDLLCKSQAAFASSGQQRRRQHSWKKTFENSQASLVCHWSENFCSNNIYCEQRFKKEDFNKNLVVVLRFLQNPVDKDKLLLNYYNDHYNWLN